MSSEGKKYDEGKPGLDLLPYDALVEIAKVLDFGAKKYAPGNWAKGIEYRRLISACQRHLGEFNEGRDTDSESGINHIAHAACNLLFLLWMIKNRPDKDNRWIKEAQQSEFIQVATMALDGCIKVWPKIFEVPQPRKPG